MTARRQHESLYCRIQRRAAQLVSFATYFYFAFVFYIYFVNRPHFESIRVTRIYRPFPTFIYVSPLKAVLVLLLLVAPFAGYAAFDAFNSKLTCLYRVTALWFLTAVGIASMEFCLHLLLPDRSWMVR
jgi:hypothetical protein